MANPFVPTVCKECDGIVREVNRLQALENKKRNAKPGLVEVVYGVHNPPPLFGRAFAYRSDIALEIGDIVLVPSSWLGELRGQRGPQEATVVSTFSDYDGAASSIIRLVRKVVNP